MVAYDNSAWIITQVFNKVWIWSENAVGYIVAKQGGYKCTEFQLCKTRHYLCPGVEGLGL